MINDVVKTGLQPAVNTSVPTTANAEKSVAVVEPTSSTLPESKETVQLDSEALGQAVSKLNDYVQNIRRTLSFSISETTGRTIIEVYDSETDELIRQIPPDQTVKLAENLEEIATDASFFVKERA